MSHRSAYAKQLIHRLNYMTLATATKDGQPWNSPVGFAYDGESTFYWGSRLDTQHSKNITENARGFIVIYDSTVPLWHGEAFYAQVIYEELGNTPELDKAIELFHKRVGWTFIARDQMLGLERRLYKATVKKAWVKDPEQDIRHEVQLLAND